MSVPQRWLRINWVVSLPSPCLFTWHLGVGGWTWHMESQEFGPWSKIPVSCTEYVYNIHPPTSFLTSSPFPLIPIPQTGGHSYVDSYPGPLFCSTGFHICFCASTMLLLFTWLCIILWSQVLWYLQHCSLCSVLPWLLAVFCVSKWTLG
jgi:hypothetical protein